jgi:hypothetical protein
MTGKKIIGLIVASAAVLATATACGLGDKITEPFQDAPRSGIVNSQPVDIITDADGFSNLATKCDHGDRLFIAFHSNGAYASVTVSPHDASCRGDVSVAAAGAGN